MLQRKCAEQRTAPIQQKNEKPLSNKTTAKNNAEQLSEDVVTFLKWSAEPELEVRKNLGIKVILFFLILGTIVYLAKNRLWREVH